MKRVLTIFAGVFAIFASVGFFNGFRGQRDLEQLLRAAAERVEVREGDDAHLYLLAAESGPGLRYRFEVDANALTVDAGSLGMMQQDKGRRLFGSIDAQLVTPFFASLAGMWTARDIVMPAGQSASKRTDILAGIAGALSGYAVGWLIADRWKPGMDSTPMREALKKAENWKRVERLVLARMVNMLEALSPGMDPKTKTTRDQVLAAGRQACLTETVEIDSGLFRRLSALRPVGVPVNLIGAKPAVAP